MTIPKQDKTTTTQYYINKTLQVNTKHKDKPKEKKGKTRTTQDNNETRQDKTRQHNIKQVKKRQ